MRKILLIGNYPKDRQYSMKKYAEVLEKGLPQYGFETELMVPSVVFSRWGHPYRGHGKWLGYFDKFILFPKRLQRKACEMTRQQPGSIVHIVDHSNAVYLPHLVKFRRSITCHDFLAMRSGRDEFPEIKLGPSGKKFQNWILASLKTAPRAVCISRATFNDAHRLAGLKEAQLKLIYNGLNFPFQKISRQEAVEIIRTENPDLLPQVQKPFLFHVGANTWYKNRLGVMKIFKRVQQSDSNLGFILAGPELDANLQNWVHQNPNNFSFALNCSNKALMAFYNLASLLVFPSLEEGFGWPIAEAMACGCPVVTSNKAPMNEIGSDAAVYIDPKNIEDAAQVILELMGNPGSLQKMARGGLHRAVDFSSEKMLSQYSEFFNAI